MELTPPTTPPEYEDGEDSFIILGSSPCNSYSMDLYKSTNSWNNSTENNLPFNSQAIVKDYASVKGKFNQIS